MDLNIKKTQKKPIWLLIIYLLFVVGWGYSICQ